MESIKVPEKNKEKKEVTLEKEDKFEKRLRDSKEEQKIEEMLKIEEKLEKRVEKFKKAIAFCSTAIVASGSIAGLSMLGKVLVEDLKAISFLMPAVENNLSLLLAVASSATFASMSITIVALCGYLKTLKERNEKLDEIYKKNTEFNIKGNQKNS